MHKTIETVTAEDLEFDRELQKMAETTPLDEVPIVEVKAETTKPETLKGYVDNYKPANTITELEDQVFQAKQLNIDAVEGSDALIKHFVRTQFDQIKEKVGYFLYKDVRVYFAGFLDKNKRNDKRTIDQINHGMK